MSSRGAFIVVEGLDRSGKTTQTKLVAQKLTENGFPSLYLNFPDRTTQIGQRISDYLQKKLQLEDEEIHKLFSDNRHELKDKLLTLLKSGTNLIVDRYSYSGAAFTAAKAVLGMDLGWCFEHELGLPAPDAVIFMEVSPSVALKRGGYGDECYENPVFQQKAKNQFLLMRQVSPTWEESVQKYHHHHAVTTTPLGHVSDDNLDQKTDSEMDLPTTLEKQTRDESKDDAINPSDDISPQIINDPEYIAPWITVNADYDFDTVQTNLYQVILPIIKTVQQSPIYTFVSNPF